MLKDSPYDPKKVVRLEVKPFDVRWGYVDKVAGLWNRSRPELIAADALPEEEFLLVCRRAPRALNGAAVHFTRSLFDQHIMHKDVYAIPAWLPAPEPKDRPVALFELNEPDEPEENRLPWRPNLSEFALDYLAGLGVENASISKPAARVIWRHVLAVGHSPLYLDENDDAIRNDWPCVPLPTTAEALYESAGLGERLAALLNLRQPVAGVDTGKVAAHLAAVGVIGRTDDAPVAESELNVTAGWASEQSRTTKAGVVTRIVMPGAGRMVTLPRTASEDGVLTAAQRDLLGEEVLDIYLNDHVRWSGVPQAAWDFKVGGFQVLRKWLSYREQRILGRGLTVTEAREFTSIVRRLSEIVLLGPALDANYVGVTEARNQEELWEDD